MNRMALMMVPFLARNPMPVDIDFTSGVLDPRITFTRGSGATRVNAAGLIESVGDNVPRFDHDPVTLAPKGLLIEEQRTNLLLRSADFGNASWNKLNATIDADAALAPDGTMSADKLIADASASRHIAYQVYTSAANTSHTLSFFLKAAGYQFAVLTAIRSAASSGAGFVINLSTGAVTLLTAVAGWSHSAAATYVGGGVWRVTLTTTNTTDVINSWIISPSPTDTPVIDVAYRTASFTGDGTSGIYVWGAQVEVGSFRGTVIPTTTAAVTRALDLAVITGERFSRWFNPVEGTFLVEFDVTGIPTTNGDALMIGTGTNAHYLRVVAGGGLRYLVFANDSLTINLNLGSNVIVPGVPVKAAFHYAKNDFAGVVTGGAVQTANVSDLPVVSSLTLFSALCGHAKRLRYWPKRLSNAQKLELVNS